MWQQLYDPLNQPLLSALAAAVPMVFFLLALTVFRLKALTAAAITLGLSLMMALWLFGMPLQKAVMAALLGVANGLWPIGYIVLMAVWLYRVAVKSGKFEIIRGSIATISEDQRIQVLLIAFCFGAFLEGAAGFGVPIAICAALLVELGFKPIRAAMLCLVANAAAGAYGAIGIPVIVGAQQGGVTTSALAPMLIAILQLSTLFIPAMLVMILDGWRGLKQTWPVVLLVGVLFSGSQALVLFLLGPELVDVVPPLLSMGALALFMRVWRPKHIYREPGAPPVSATRWPLKAVLLAWSPFYILTAIIMVWSLPAFRALFAAGGALAATVLQLPIPGLHLQVQELPPIVTAPHALAALWKIELLGAAGTAILLSVIVTTLTSKTLSLRQSLDQLLSVMRDLWRPLATICLVMAVAYVANFSGTSSTLGLALAETGRVFPLISPVIGWLGVFITGSVVNNNVLFAHLQAVTAGQIGTSQTLLVAANTAGGVMAKVVSPQSIAIAAGAVGLVGHESDIMRATLRFSLALLVYACLWTFALSLLV
ncbi:L-lactate permease [Kushneria pakistanensis]|uniref:L-lactate permease n=1 Tax=Kushneria pakistanensis TaxID=1508770 RepID=A0ABQ3FHS3_9GAMM|nr:lactate permease LctP family transporter [Kushneria pakistanensis]GHC24878.1 L-lactate permease [Kushneria pakistanensis]